MQKNAPSKKEPQPVMYPNVFSKEVSEEQHPFMYSVSSGWNYTSKELSNLHDYYKEFSFEGKNEKELHKKLLELLFANSTFRKQTGEMQLRFMQSLSIEPFINVMESLKITQQFIDEKKDNKNVKILKDAFHYCVESFNAYAKAMSENAKFASTYKTFYENYKGPTLDSYLDPDSHSEKLKK